MQYHGSCKSATLTIWLTALLLILPSQAMRFIALGDWGTPEIAKVVPYILEQVTNDTAAMLMVGDNFYDYGVQDVNDPKFQSVYEIPFHDFPLNVVFQVIAGNHDYYLNIQAQIDYADPLYKRWYFPSLYYTRAYANEEFSVLTINLDAFSLAGGESGLSGPLATDRRQLHWLEQQLREQAHLFDWVVVVSHYPVYSCNEYSDTKAFENEIFPLLIKYRVDTYVSGHIHLLQHVAKQGLNMFVSGSGARYIPQAHCVLGKNSDGVNVLAVQENAYGFIVLDFAATKLRATFHRVSLDGKEHREVYETYVDRVKKKSPHEQQTNEGANTKKSTSLRQIIVNRLRSNKGQGD